MALPYPSPTRNEDDDHDDDCGRVAGGCTGAVAAAVVVTSRGVLTVVDAISRVCFVHASRARRARGDVMDVRSKTGLCFRKKICGYKVL